MTELETIKALLKEKLENLPESQWSSLVNSLIGKELIAYGAEVINQAVLVKDSMLNSFNYQVADEQSLISIANVACVPLAFTKPSVIRLQVVSPTIQVYKPYDLKFVVGSNTYYNIEPFTSSETITLYQGTIKTMTMGVSKLSDIEIDTEIPWYDLKLSENENKIEGQLIGNAIPDSVYYFYKEDSTNKLLSKYDAVSAGTDSRLFRVKTLSDLNNMVVVKDKLLGIDSGISSSRQIIWLQPTFATTSTTGSLESKMFGTLQYNEVSFTQGVAYSLEYARQQYAKFYSEMTAITSKSQIENYIKSSPYIEDVNLVAVNNNVTAYIKPTDINDSGLFGEIESKLDLYGSFLVKHSLLLGTPIKVSFTITGDFTTQEKESIQNYVRERYSWSNLGFKDIPELSEVVNYVWSKFNKTSKVYYRILNESVTGRQLKFIPIQNSIRLISAGEEVGYDYMGSILKYAKTLDSRIPIIPENTLGQSLGNFIINSSPLDSAVVKFKDGVIYNTDFAYLKQYLHVSDYSTLSAFSNSGLTYAIQGNHTVTVFDTSQLYEQAFAGVVTPKANSVTLSELQRGYSIPIYHHNVWVLLKFSSSLQLDYYDTSGNKYYSFNTGIVNKDETIKGYIVQGSDLIVFLSTQYVRISNFTESRINYIANKLFADDKILVDLYFYDKGYGVAAINDNSTMKLYSFSDFSNSFVGLLEVSSLNGYTEKVLVSTNEAVYQVFESGKDSLLISRKTGEQYPQTVNDSYPTYEINSNQVVGSVSYVDGAYLTDSESSLVSYNSVTPVLDENNYLVLDEDNLIIWD